MDVSDSGLDDLGEPIEDIKGPSSMTASTLAKTQESFRRWALSLGIDLAWTIEWSNPEFDRMMGEVKYPLCIRSAAVTELFRTYDPTDSVSRWVTSLVDGKLEVEDTSDPYSFKLVYPALACAWKSVNNALERNEGEASKRKGVDTLIEIAFDVRPGGKHAVALEMDIVLPEKAQMPVKVALAKADSLALIMLPLEWCRVYMTSDIRSRCFEWATPSSDHSLTPSVITFAFEAKQENRQAAVSQLTMYLVSGQHHRRALGLKDSPLFGAVLVNTTFSVFVCLWDKEYLTTYPTKYCWDFMKGSEFIECYFFLSRLSDYMHDIIRVEFEDWDKDRAAHHAKIQENLCKPSWRPLDPQLSSRKSSETKHGDSAGTEDMDCDEVASEIENDTSDEDNIYNEELRDKVLSVLLNTWPGEGSTETPAPLREENVIVHTVDSHLADREPDRKSYVRKWIQN
ncbi:hypothetical protein DFH11DRAFT_492161 [Phellopilus nigrolimitatus]|nr:hypothetical protein DFH11DRAFT_492161 [Phellopilus nigrolimitatus]